MAWVDLVNRTPPFYQAYPAQMAIADNPRTTTATAGGPNSYRPKPSTHPLIVTPEFAAAFYPWYPAEQTLPQGLRVTGLRLHVKASSTTNKLVVEIMSSALTADYNAINEGTIYEYVNEVAIDELYENSWELNFAPASAIDTDIRIGGTPNGTYPAGTGTVTVEIAEWALNVVREDGTEPSADELALIAPLADTGNEEPPPEEAPGTWINFVTRTPALYEFAPNKGPSAATRSISKIDGDRTYISLVPQFPQDTHDNSGSIWTPEAKALHAYDGNEILLPAGIRVCGARMHVRANPGSTPLYVRIYCEAYDLEYNWIEASEIFHRQDYAVGETMDWSHEVVFEPVHIIEGEIRIGPPSTEAISNDPAQLEVVEWSIKFVHESGRELTPQEIADIRGEEVPPDEEPPDEEPPDEEPPDEEPPDEEPPVEEPPFVPATPTGRTINLRDNYASMETFADHFDMPLWRYIVGPRKPEDAPYMVDLFFYDYPLDEHIATHIPVNGDVLEVFWLTRRVLLTGVKIEVVNPSPVVLRPVTNSGMLFSRVDCSTASENIYVLNGGILDKTTDLITNSIVIDDPDYLGLMIEGGAENLDSLAIRVQLMVSDTFGYNQRTNSVKKDGP